MPGTQEECRPLVLGIGADMFGYDLKEELRDALEADPCVAELRDFGVFSDDDPRPYPEVGIAVAECVRAGQLDRAILICGTGIGMAVSANKVPGVRATVAYDPYSVERSVLSNDCQVLTLGGKVVTPDLARRIAKDWLRYRFDASSPSAAKIEIIRNYEHVAAQYEPSTLQPINSRASLPPLQPRANTNTPSKDHAQHVAERFTTFSERAVE